MLGEVQMPQVDESDVVSLWQPRVDRPVTIEETKPHESDLGVPIDADGTVLKQSLLSKPFNTAAPGQLSARAEYDEKVGLALQKATTRIVLSAHQHLPTLSKIRTIRETLEHYKPKIDAGEVPERIAQELKDFYEWTLEEQYTHPKTLEKYLRDARRLFDNAGSYYQLEQVILILKTFLPHLNPMTEQYLPPENKDLPEATIKQVNDFIRWASEADVTHMTFQQQQALLIQALYQCCRSFFNRFSAVPYGEELYYAITALPLKTGPFITVEIMNAIELASRNQNRQDCLLDLVCKTFPSFMTLTLKGSENQASSSVSSNEMYLNDASSNNMKSSSNASPVLLSPSPPPPPPPPHSSESALSTPSLMRRKHRISSQADTPLPVPFAQEEEEISGSPLKRAVSKAISIQDAVDRLHGFLENESETDRAERLSRLEHSKKPVVEQQHQIQHMIRSLRKTSVQPRVTLSPPEPELTEAEKLKQTTSEQIQAFLFAQRKKEGNINSESEDEGVWTDDESQDDNPIENFDGEETDSLCGEINRLKLTSSPKPSF